MKVYLRWQHFVLYYAIADFLQHLRLLFNAPPSFEQLDEVFYISNVFFTNTLLLPHQPLSEDLIG